MLSGKDLLAQFKAASWKTPEEIETFVASAEAPAAPDLAKLFEVVSGKAPDATVQRLRLAVFVRLVDKNPDKALFAPFVKALKGAEAGMRTAGHAAPSLIHTDRTATCSSVRCLPSRGMRFFSSLSVA